MKQTGQVQSASLSSQSPCIKIS